MDDTACKRMRDAIACNSGLPRMQVLMMGVTDGSWTFEDVEAFESVSPERPSRPPPSPDAPRPRTRRKPIPRRIRCRSRLIRFQHRYIRRQSISATLDGQLRAGAVRTLNYVMSRAGKRKSYSTYTCYVAADLGVTPRTVQNHFRELERNGYLVRSAPCRRTGKITIYVTERCEPPPFKLKGAEPLVLYGQEEKIVSHTNKINLQEEELYPESAEAGPSVEVACERKDWKKDSTR